MRRKTLFHILLVTLCLATAQGAAAQTDAPSPEKMIEQLRAPRTRSLRNLLVEQVPLAPNALASQSGSVGTAAPAGTAVPPASGGAEQTAAGQPAVAPAAEVGASDAAASRPSLSLLIQFDFNSARVRPESQQALANLSQALQSAELLGSRFSVEGHTDAKGGAEYNRRLSELRALAVRDFLKARGVAEERLVAAGKGASDLANASEPFAAENRRVRIVNLD